MNRFIKLLLIKILLVAVVSFELNAQNGLSVKIQNSINLFESISTSESKYELNFIEEKNTLYFKYDLNDGNRIGYKAILEDIHPEGIFIAEIEGTTFLRVLSVNNGKVFVKEKFRGEFRLSNNTNLIDIQLPKNFDEGTLKNLIQSLKLIFVKEEIEPIIDNIDLPKTKYD